MESNNIEKLELHIVRLEQALRQLERLKRMGIPNSDYDSLVNRYLDGILEAKQKIEKLKSRDD